MTLNEKKELVYKYNFFAESVCDSQQAFKYVDSRKLSKAWKKDLEQRKTWLAELYDEIFNANKLDVEVERTSKGFDKLILKEDV